MAREELRPVYDALCLQTGDSLNEYVIAGIVGSWIHVLLDSFLYADMSLVVFRANPFLTVLGAPEVYGLCAAGFLAGSVLLVWRVRRLS